MSAQPGDHRFSNEDYVLVDAPEGDGWTNGVAPAPSPAAPMKTAARASVGQIRAELAASAEQRQPDATTEREKETEQPAWEDPSW